MGEMRVYSSNYIDLILTWLAKTKLHVSAGFIIVKYYNK